MVSTKTTYQSEWSFVNSVLKDVSRIHSVFTRCSFPTKQASTEQAVFIGRMKDTGGTSPVEKKSFMPKVNIWVVISSRHVIGPFFFEDEDGKALKIYLDCYVSVLQQYFLPELKRRRKRSNSCLVPT